MQWPLLESLPTDDRARILDSARRRHFKRGETVFHEGDEGDSLHLVETGTFAVQVSAPAGERATINVLSPGDFFGELSLLQRPQSSQTPRRSATVFALAPAQTLALAGSAFTALRNAHPSVEHLVVAALAHRVEQLSNRLLEALYIGVDRRVYLRLIELAEIYRKPPSDTVIPLTQGDLATMAGASRPTVNQVLQKLVSRAIVSLDRRQITILDLPALRAAAPDVGPPAWDR
ncbi:MAG: family transcriptional regulator, cyclic receptor protein [Actinomycetota bacterium]|jgi:CRP-like cAMP-binding protein|nr:family transcriptional regulator, cyclic receptor protein [Actinomycetota bacterium]